MKDWQIVRDANRVWYAYVFADNGRCEGCCGPFKSSRLAKICAEGMWSRWSKHKDIWAGLR